MLELEGYILTGGAGSRMGRDKSTLELGGATLGQRAARILENVATTVSAVGRPVPGIPTVRDVLHSKNERAAIFGVQAALHSARTEWAVILSCDLPFITAEFFRLLISIAESAAVDAVVPVQPDGRLQPLAAVYRTGPCLTAVETMLAAGQRRLQEICERVETRRVPPNVYSNLAGCDKFFFNVNTPEDYRTAIDKL